MKQVPTNNVNLYFLLMFQSLMKFIEPVIVELHCGNVGGVPINDNEKSQQLL